MLRGFYTAASGMIAGQRRQEVLSNNMANALTPGFKQDEALTRAFPEMLISRMDKQDLPLTGHPSIQAQNPIGALNTGVYVQETITNHEQGALRTTGMMTDVAIVNGSLSSETGGLFFTAENGEGEQLYTRNGNFTIDSQGFLTTSGGYYILNQTGERIFTNGQAFTVTPEGYLDVLGTRHLINIAYVENTDELIKQDQDFFSLVSGDEAVDARELTDTSFTVSQRFLETSNVDTAQTMTEMMHAYRSFEMNQRVLQAYDQSLDIAVNQIGRLT